MRFSEFKKHLSEALPSIVDTVHANLANNSTVGGAGADTTAPTPNSPNNNGTVNTIGTVNNNSGNLGQQPVTPNFTVGAIVKMKDGTSYKVTGVNAGTQQVTLTNLQVKPGQPASVTYNNKDIANSIAQ